MVRGWDWIGLTLAAAMVECRGVGNGNGGGGIRGNGNGGGGNGQQFGGGGPISRDARQNSEMTIPTYGEWNHFVSAARTVQLHTFGSLEG